MDVDDLKIEKIDVVLLVDENVIPFFYVFFGSLVLSG